MWKRREHEIAHLWNMSGYKGDDAEMPDYKADITIDRQTKSIKKNNVANTYFRRLTGEIPSTVISIAIVVAIFYGYYKFSHDNKGKAAYSGGSSVINAIAIVILSSIYKKVAYWMTNWENHRYAEDWENSLISKNFSF
jgi:hypothetical protein